MSEAIYRGRVRQIQSGLAQMDELYQHHEFIHMARQFDHVLSICDEHMARILLYGYGRRTSEGNITGNGGLLELAAQVGMVDCDSWKAMYRDVKDSHCLDGSELEKYCNRINSAYIQQVRNLLDNAESILDNVSFLGSFFSRWKGRLGL